MWHMPGTSTHVTRHADATTISGGMFDEDLRKATHPAVRKSIQQPWHRPIISEWCPLP